MPTNEDLKNLLVSSIVEGLKSTNDEFLSNYKVHLSECKSAKSDVSELIKKVDIWTERIGPRI